MSENVKKVAAFAPISIGNVSVGFDSLGLAVSPINGELIGDIVSVSSSDENTLVVAGTHRDRLPQNPQDNIVWDCLLAFNEHLSNREIGAVSVAMELKKNIPVSSGLGSSACSVVASFYALNEFYNRPFNEAELLQLMAEQEGKISGSIHYDNIAPCYLGGMQLMVPSDTENDNSEIPCLTIPTFDQCYWVMAYPDIEVSTKAAREILPTAYDRSTTVKFGQQLATFIAASYENNLSLAMNVLNDVIAEPYRESLLPGFPETRQALLSMGCLGVGISGSGPTLFCITDSKELAEQAHDYLKANYIKNEGGFVSICQADTAGTRLI